ncbi:MAG: hypothetical protein IMY82_04325 [Chloroflexi bacterium]|nr:hypothetical protein [Chloroflexota bacterium]
MRKAPDKINKIGTLPGTMGSVPILFNGIFVLSKKNGVINKQLKKWYSQSSLEEEELFRPGRIEMNLSRKMTFLGLVALIYYAVLLALGVVSTDVMPQFLISAILFLSAGRLMRNGDRNPPGKEGDEESEKKQRAEPNWALWTQVLNWVMAALIICALGLWVMKPVGVSFFDMLPF